VQFIINELSQHGPGGAAQAAQHRFGCRVIQRLLEHCGAEQLAPFVKELVADAVPLSAHPYGNFVVLHLLEHCTDAASPITSALEQYVSVMAADGCIGAVIEKALSVATNEGSVALATTLLKDPERLTTMACSRWGNKAVKQALQLVDDSTRRESCANLLQRSARLRSNRYGRLIDSFIVEQPAMPVTWTN